MTQAASPTPPYDVIVARNVGCVTRDGVRLSTDIYRPAINGEAAPGRFPAIITRSPYDTRSGKGPSSQAKNGEFFASHGYLYSVQDCRGRWESEGEFVLLDNEGPDGYDAIEFLAALPYCTGDVGTQGTSLRAWNQNAAALKRPPHLKCMWINQGGANGNTSALRHNGAMELRWLSWACAYAPVSREARANPKLQAALTREAERMYEWFQKLPWTPGDSPLAALPNWEKWAIDLLTHGDDDEFWLNKTRNFEPYKDQSADVPTMYAGSWYDSYTLATVEKFGWFKDSLKHQYLMMGPGIHGGPHFDHRMAGDVDMGPNAPIAGNLAQSRLHMMLQWYDRWLKGTDNSIDRIPKVRVFVMGGGGGRINEGGSLIHGGHWRDEADWPLARATPTDFFLRPGGELAAGQAPAEGGSSTFRFDPSDPLPTISGNVSSLTENLPPPPRYKPFDPTLFRRSIVVQGAADQVTREDVHCKPPFGAPLTDRPDVLAFTTAPLEAPMEATGPIEVDLYLSSSAPDTDLYCMLLDLYPESDQLPNGFRLNIADGIFRVRYREGMSRPKLMAPGEIVRVRFQLYPTSNVFDRGHRLQLLVSSSSFPRFDVNPNTGEPIGRNTRREIAVNTIHHSAASPSRIILPVVKA